MTFKKAKSFQKLFGNMEKNNTNIYKHRKQ